MIIFKDLLGGGELFTDAERWTTAFGGLFYVVHGKTSTQKVGGDIDQALIGGNPSQEEEQEQLADCDVVSGIDICLAYDLEKNCPLPKKLFLKVFNCYMKSLVEKWPEVYGPEKTSKLKKLAKEHIPEFLKLYNEDECDIFNHSSIKLDPSGKDATGMPILGVWDASGTEIDLYFFANGVHEEKV